MRVFSLPVLVLLLALLSSAQDPAPGNAPKQAAEGAYGAFDSWTLWSDPGEEQIRAEIDMHIAADVARTKGKPIAQHETLLMERDFTMRGFRYESKNFSGLPDGALDCTVRPEIIDCVSTFGGGDSGRGKIKASGGYATQFGVEMAFLDLPWFFTTLVGHSDRDPKQPRTLGILTIAFDGKTPDTLITGNGADAVVTYPGVETIRILGHDVKAQKFQVEARHYRATIWTSEAGLLLAADWAGMRMELTRFRQWAPLVPELPVEPRPATSAIK